jgi:hypothetical protein
VSCSARSAPARFVPDPLDPVVSYGAAVHDYFDVVGVSSDAPRQEIRRACARRPRRWHPDFDGPSLAPSAPGPRFDVAIDFADMTVILDRMQAAFFGRRD